MQNFTTATAVVPRSTEAGRVRFDTSLDAQWSVGAKLHGGYLLAVLGRAAAQVAGAEHPHLTAISGSFVVAPEPGAAEVEVELLRAGRGLSQLRARLAQGGRVCVEALVTQGNLAQDEAWWTRSRPVELPAEDECVPVPAEPPGAGFAVPLMDVVEQRLDPAGLGFLGGKPSGNGVIAGWQRLADGSDWDPLSLLVALDQVPPVSLDLGIPGWAPTVQFSAYVRGLPVPGPVRVRVRGSEVGGDRMDETARVWDAKDRLVAQATQIAAVRIPDTPAPG